MAQPFYKTTIIIWSHTPTSKMEISTIAQEAESGEFYCSRHQSEKIEQPATDPDWDGTEFGTDESDETFKDIELDNGGVIEAPDEEGVIRRRDADGNTEDVKRPEDPDYNDLAQFFPGYVPPTDEDETD
jgi:hypothetical protein